MKNNNLFLVTIFAAIFSFAAQHANAQYCAATHAVACNATTNINDFSITGTTLNNIGTGCTSGTSQAFTIYPPTASTTATLILGQSYTFNVTCPGNMILSMWIDFNHDFVYDASEWTQIATTTTANVPVSATITIPLTSVAGPTGLRLRSRLSGNTNGSGDACLSFGSGESEEYTITLDPGVPCTGLPVAGTTTSNDTTVCPNTSFNVSLAGSTIASGLTYQWESSPNNTTWTPIAGANFISFQTTQTSDTYYHCIVTCSGQSSISTSLFVLTNTFISCYCTSFPTGATGSDIGNVTFAGINNGIAGTPTNNAASTNTYTDFTALAPASIVQGNAYPISVEQINSAGFTVNYATLHIDFNHDGIFDLLAETFPLGASNSAVGGNIIASNVQIPFTTLTGLTRMRIVLRAGGTAAQSPCGTYGTGETEDYLVNIQAGQVCTTPPNAGTAQTNFSSICSGGSVTISLSGNSTGSGQTYLWQSSPDSINWTAIPAITATFFTTTINATIYYRCIATCSSVSDTSVSVKVGLNPPSLCYCVTGLGGGGCASYTINDVVITGTSLSNLNNGCTGTTANTLTVFPPSGNTTAALIQGVTYDLSVTLPVAAYVSVWIDWDGNGIYDASEWTQICTPTTSTANVPNIIQLTIPFSSVIGATGMRIRSRSSLPNGAPDACLSFGSGETEDYILTLLPNVACSGTPNAGTAVANPSAVCPNIPFSVSLNGATLSSGLSYQWQSSTNNTVFTNITGAISSGYSGAQTSNTYYRCIMSCSGASDTSTSVLVTVNLFATCYCNSAATNTNDDDIGNVTFGSLNNGVGTPALTNPTSTNTYSNFTALPPQTYLQGISYPLSITQINLNGFYSCRAAVFIDFNQDGIYDPNSEMVFNGQTVAGNGGNVVAGNVIIPLNSIPGNTGMRIILREGTIMPLPCGTYTYGETEDYVIFIMQAPPCVAPPAAGSTTASDSTVCPNINFQLSLNGSALASGLSYQWESSPDSITWTPISGATTLYYQNSQISSTYYHCVVSCNGIASTSNALFVSTNTFISCYCISGATSTTGIDIGNVTFGLAKLNNGTATPITNNPSSVNTYSDYTTLAPFNYSINAYHPISVAQICLAGFSAARIAAFIDYDHDGIFDPSAEIVFGGATVAGLGGNVVIDSILIPPTALTGLTRMRFVLLQGTASPNPCGTYFNGETEDYLINILGDTPCSIPFSAGTAESTLNDVCSSDIFTLSLNGLSPDTGYSFQWQKSSNNIAWTNISGASTQFYSTTQNFPSYYRCSVICSVDTSNKVISTALFVNKKQLSLCSYCNSVIGGNCGINYFIDSVAIGQTTLNNSNTGCAANAGFAYSKYPASGNTTTDLGAGNTYELFVKTAGVCSVSLWIDNDQSGTFDENEWKQVTASSDTTVATTYLFQVSDSAKLGLTGMRIRSRISGGVNNGTDACANFGSGETEDYFVTIVSAISVGNELSNDKNVRIFPNPTSGLLTLEYRTDGAQLLNVKMCNLEGKELLNENTERLNGNYSKKMDISAANKGVYFVQFTTNKNVITKKIILN